MPLQTISTLRFGQRAKAVKTKVVNSGKVVHDVPKLLQQLESMKDQVLCRPCPYHIL